MVAWLVQLSLPINSEIKGSLYILNHVFIQVSTYICTVKFLLLKPLNTKTGCYLTHPNFGHSQQFSYQCDRVSLLRPTHYREPFLLVQRLISIAELQ